MTHANDTTDKIETVVELVALLGYLRDRSRRGERLTAVIEIIAGEKPSPVANSLTSWIRFATPAGVLVSLVPRAHPTFAGAEVYRIKLCT